MRIQLTSKDRARFEAKVDRSGGPDACHPWMGGRTADGYGQIWLDGRLEYAHRVAWVTAGNKITPEKPCVLHNCPGGDLRACCNDRHLWGGTVADNNRDIARKGRGAKSRSGFPFGIQVERNGRFGAKVQINGRTRHFGTFNTPEEASAAAVAAKVKHLAMVCCDGSPESPRS